MATNLPIGCSCGKLTGLAHDLSGRSGQRLVCYCKDCQAFPFALGREADVLDSHGGTPIFQTSSARIEFTGGLDHLACLRLTPKGLHRWYASCCNTPIGNTVGTGKLPFVGLIECCLPPEVAAADGALGPVLGRVFAKSSRGTDRPPDANAGTSLPIILRFIRIMLAARFRGDRARSPFFDPATGEPVVIPRILSPSELKDVEAKRGAA